MELRQLAEDVNLAKSGSVEVIRARLIQHQILGEDDLSWEGIQSMPHKEIGEVLRIFGIKTSGSHKERRQRLWLHLNFDSRRMTIERLAEIGREKLHEMCQRLELPLTGNRTVLMGRVAGVLTSQGQGWGRIKRSLRRNGLPDVVEEQFMERDNHLNSVEIRLDLDQPFDEIESEPDETVESDSILENAKMAALEDAHDSLILGFEDSDFETQGAILTIQARVADLDRMVGTILRGHSGVWGESETDLLLRLAKRRGWPLSNPKISQRVGEVGTDMAEIKGAELKNSEENIRTVDDDIMERIRKKISESQTMIGENEN
jgi:hypothetical protein|tara:strand:+ start:710 stop:1663 length:954 start_codon:yes stop_codon:yes gene_type:complete